MNLTAKDIEDAPKVACKHKDLGLCYVDQITIGPKTILIATPRDQGEDINKRVESVSRQLKEKGIFLDPEFFR